MDKGIGFPVVRGMNVKFEDGFGELSVIILCF